MPPLVSSCAGFGGGRLGVSLAPGEGPGWARQRGCQGGAVTVSPLAKDADRMAAAPRGAKEEGGDEPRRVVAFTGPQGLYQRKEMFAAKQKLVPKETEYLKEQRGMKGQENWDSLSAPFSRKMCEEHLDHASHSLCNLTDAFNFKAEPQFPALLSQVTAVPRYNFTQVVTVITVTVAFKTSPFRGEHRSPSQKHPAPKTTTGFCKVEVTPDSRSAHPDCILTEDLRNLGGSDRSPELSDNLEGFDVVQLGQEKFKPGRFMWEVETQEEEEESTWTVGIVQGSVVRKECFKISFDNGVQATGGSLNNLSSSNHLTAYYFLQWIPLNLSQKSQGSLDSDDLIVTFQVGPFFQVSNQPSNRKGNFHFQYHLCPQTVE